MYGLYQCLECGSRFHDVGEHEQGDLSTFYDSIAVRRQVDAIEDRRYWGREVRLIKGLCSVTVRKVLDVGCRSGDFLTQWPMDVQKHGIELSTHSASIARRRGLNVEMGPVEDTRFASMFDVVTAYAVLEHVTQPAEVLQRLSDLVAEGGVFAIMIPSYETWKARLLERSCRNWHMASPPNHLNYFSRRFLDVYLQSRGFSLARRRYTSGGMFNPLRRVPVARSLCARTMSVLDTMSPLNRIPLFDHMYSYYVRRRTPQFAPAAGRD